MTQATYLSCVHTRASVATASSGRCSSRHARV